MARRSLLFNDSDAKGPKVSEVFALTVNETCTRKALDCKFKEIEAKHPRRSTLNSGLS